MALFGKKKRKHKPSAPDEIIHTKLRGVTQKNPDGVKRQKLLKKCRPSEKLTLETLPKSQTGGKSIVNVKRLNGALLGELSYDRSEDIQLIMTTGAQIEAEITKITGGGLFFRRTRGCNIEIKVWWL